ncbi:MAG: thiamine pyrophosphate-binding protein [Acidobacteria bacterium]|nr:thiamine pyrophosphate-binding protein [Acidobacteriota bacterium]
MQIEGKHALIELLVQEGIDLLVGNPGSTELALMDALVDEDRVRYVLGLQEAVVVAIADGYAQATGRLVAVNVHAAPGLGNAMGMLYNAKKSGSPILVTAGQQDHSIALSEPLLWDDLATLARPLVKWSYEVRSLAELPQALHRAAKTALAPPTGPVFLSIPADVLTVAGDIDLQGPTRVAARGPGDPDAIDRAAALLASAQAPIVFAGDAVAHGDALDELVALAELLGAPVYAEDIANTASFPTSHPLFAGTAGRLAGPLRALLDRHDLLVSIGADLFSLSLSGGPPPVPPGMRVVHVDTDPWQLGKNVPTEVALLGDPKAVLPPLTAALGRLLPTGAGNAARRQAVIAAIAADRDALDARASAAADAQPVKALAVLQALGRALPADVVVVEESLSSSEGVRLLIPSNDRASFFGMRGSGIGWGLPAAAGVKLGIPDRPVLAIIGDGGLLYTPQALWTMAHERLAVTVLVLNNRSYRILKQRTRALGGRSAESDRYVAMDLTDPEVDVCGLARSFGVAAERVTTIPDILAAVHQGLASAAPFVVDAVIDGAL